MISSIAGWEKLSYFADALTFSPRPDPMTGTSYYEHIAQKVMVTLFSKNKKIARFDALNRVNTLGGSHTRKVVYLLSIGLLPVETTPLTKQILRVLFCPQGLLYIDSSVSSFSLLYHDRRTRREMLFHVTCHI